jgi:hypothetical protein
MVLDNAFRHTPSAASEGQNVGVAWTYAYSGQVVQLFHSKLSTYSGRSCPLIPIDVVHFFGNPGMLDNIPERWTTSPGIRRHITLFGKLDFLPTPCLKALQLFNSQLECRTILENLADLASFLSIAYLCECGLAVHGFGAQSIHLANISPCSSPGA